MTFSPKVDGRRNKVLLGGLSSAGVFPAISLTAYANTSMQYVPVEAKTWTLHPDGSVSIVRPDESKLDLESGTFVLTDGQIFVLAEDTDQEIYGLLFFFGGTALAVGIGGQGPADMETVIEGSDSGMVTEDGAAGSSTVATGRLHVSDRADDAALFVSQDNVSARYGTFSITTTGAWTYTLDNDSDDVQGLGEDDQLEDAFIARSIDGTEATVDISIQGTNDEAEVTGDITGNLPDDRTTDTVTGSLSLSDADTNDNPEFMLKTDAISDRGYGTFSLTLGDDGDWQWDYTLNNDHENVRNTARGDTLSDSLTLQVVDGDTVTGGQSIEIAIEGRGVIDTIELSLKENLAGTGYQLDSSRNWSIIGDDAAAFELGDNNEIRFKDGRIPDYENPADVGNNNVYEIMLTGQVDGDLDIERNFEITIEDDNHPVVTLTDSSWFGLGWSYSGVGDVNNDDVDDIVASYGFSYRARVIYGSRDLSADASSTKDLNSTTDIQFGDLLQAAIPNPLVASAGDLNRDGTNDFFVSNSYFPNPNGGALYFNGSVIFGGESPTNSDNESQNNAATNQLEILGIPTKSATTVVPAVVGDIDGDGFEDLAIVSLVPNSDTTDLSYYVIFSSPQPASDTASGVHQIDFRNETPSDTYETASATMFVDGTASDRSPAISALGDINSDGIDDFVLTSGLGNSAYVVFGEERNSNGELNFDGTPSVTISGLSPSSQSNAANNIVLAAADINGDGINDIILGSPESESGGNENAGKVFVVFGRESDWGGASDMDDDTSNQGDMNDKGYTFDLNAINGENGFVITGADANDQLGRGVANAGDVNGDGVDDIVITSNSHDGYVFFGGQTAGTEFSINSLDGSNGFKIQNVPSSDSHRPFLPAGDFNQDGFDDIMVGSPVPNSSSLYVLFGAQEFDNIVTI